MARRAFSCLLLFAAGCADHRSAPPPDLGIYDAAAAADLAGPAPDGSDGGAAACPAGATLVRAALGCGAAGSAPATAAALAPATRGDVVVGSDAEERALPCLPVLVCSPGDAPTLLFSDEPESPAADGVLYADTLAPGRYRVYVYHANGAAPSRKFPVVVLNQGAQPATLVVGARGVAGPSASYIAVGKQAALAWLLPRAPTTVTVPPGQRVLLDAGLDALHAAQTELVHAIIDFSVDATVKLSVVSVPAAADATVVTGTLSLLPNSGAHLRGTFARAGFLLASPAPLDGARRLRLGGGGDTVEPALAGVDAVDGNQPVMLGGNYGVPLAVALAGGRLAAAVSARGGAWGGAAQLPAGSDGAAGALALPAAVEALVDTTHLAVAGRYATGGATLTLLTAGGASTPIDLVV